VSLPVDGTTDEEVSLERGRLLFAGPCDFMLGVVQQSGLPNPDRVEVAFAGRSNVGKSSLINALTTRKNLARTSNTPGRTQEINFFNLGDQLNIVDLPGYGYAKATRTKVEAWNELIRDYLSGRAVLHRVLLLIDARHGIKQTDQEIMALLDRDAVSFQVVLTKADKIKPAELERVLEETNTILAKHPAAHPHVHATSSVKAKGIAELRAEIASLANYKSDNHSGEF